MSGSTEAGSWDAEWRALAEKELRGAPLSSLSPKRHDGLAIAPVLSESPAETGLSTAPASRRAVLVTDRAEDLGLAIGGVWWRGPSAPPAGTALVVDERDPRWIDAASAHEAGASAVTEVAVAAFRLAREPDPAGVLVAVGTELFVEIAKLRAMRRLGARVLAARGRAPGIVIAARSAERSASLLDPATNVVRSTLGVTASMIGGADVVGALPMDVAATERSSRAARVARNVPVVADREAHLFAVDDAARGSFEVEALTNGIARDAWEIARAWLAAADAASEIERRIAEDARARRAAIASRRLPLVGASRFPLAGEPVGPARSPGALRDASAFEVARRGAALAVEVVVVGPPAAIEARVAFVREVLAVGGFAVDGADARLAVVCAADASFETELPAVIRELTARGVAAFVAGKPGPAESALRTAGAKGFVALGQDLPTFYDALRAAQGGPR
ncbi:MAG: methylmalonyl-CoA mutase family protein [Sandaracinus sp.]